MKKNQTKNNKSHKIRNKGGDINKHNAFKYILSIGYEVETDYLAKLTAAYNEEGEQILFNSDSTSRNVTFLNEQDIEEDEYEDRLRREEVIAIDAVNNEGKIDKDIEFLVTNDIATTTLTKKLNALCCQSSLKEGQEEFAYCGGEVSSELKNRLYKFYTPDGFDTKTDEEYNIEFVYFTDTECGLFSDVEWVLTYYKPVQSESIILDTFRNAVLNLTQHLEGLEKTEGSLVLNEMEIRDKEGNIIDTHPERIITNPVNRYLYKSPNYNLYYLQANKSDKLLNVDDICPTFQMTFASNIIHIFSILKQIIDDKIMSITCGKEESIKRFEMLLKIEYCADQLIQYYNQNQRNPSFKILKTESNQNTIKKLKGYLQLFLFRLYIYYNIYLEKEIRNKKENENKSVENQKTIYFKDSLFFNSRHSNYDLYFGIKKCLKELLSNALNLCTNKSPTNGRFTSDKGNSYHALEMCEGVNNITPDENKQNQIVIDLVHKLIINPAVLNQLLIEPQTLSLLNKNVFNPKNTVKKSSPNYGDPRYSLDSYLTFFEKPVDDDSNLYVDDTIMYYDWFQYKGVDKVSTQMEIKDDIVLVEIRNFQKLMSSYIYGFANESLKTDILNNKNCNKLDKFCVLGINFGHLKKFFQINNKNGMGGTKRKWKTRKNRNRFRNPK